MAMNDAPFGSIIAGDFKLAMLDDTGDFTNQGSSSLEQHTVFSHLIILVG